MEPSVPDHPPTCVLCGGDCSTVPHLRDSGGRYACAECIRLERQRRAGAEAVQPQPVAAAEAGYALAGGSEDASSPIPVAPAPPPPAGDFLCPVCIIRMPPDLGRCVQCGYDPKKGIQTSRKFRKTRTKEGARRPVCAKCGYDMTGVPGTRCPECGTVADFARRRYDRAESRRIALWSYLKPAIMLAVGLSGILLILMGTGELDMAPYYLTKLAVFVPIGVFAFFICCVLWIGFDAPFHRVALELAGIYAIVDLISLVVFSVVEVFLVNGVVIFFAYIGMLASILDLDYADAVAVAFVNLLLRLVVVISLARLFGLI